MDRPALRARRLRLELSRRRTRCASASARSGRAHHVKEPTVEARRATSGLPAEGYQGNWIPHQLRPASRGRRLLRRRLGRALPAADRRGHPHGALLRARAAGASCAPCWKAAPRASRRCARYGAFSDAHERKYRWMLRKPAGRRPPHAQLARVTALVARFENRRLCAWIFNHYLAIAPPSFVGEALRGGGSRAGRLTPVATPRRGLGFAIRRPFAGAAHRRSPQRAPVGWPRSRSPSETSLSIPGAATMSPARNTPSPRVHRGPVAPGRAGHVERA